MSKIKNWKQQLFYFQLKFHHFQLKIYQGHILNAYKRSTVYILTKKVSSYYLSLYLHYRRKLRCNLRFKFFKKKFLNSLYCSVSFLLIESCLEHWINQMIMNDHSARSQRRRSIYCIVLYCISFLSQLKKREKKRNY